ncbi:protein preY, mitochondrial [Ascaphus truei]|uniref:protein preY, mitochondrial n=1 Tax=Ascaphus truei TaxID=8439 RepID=UPI003F59FB70
MLGICRRACKALAQCSAPAASPPCARGALPTAAAPPPTLQPLHTTAASLSADKGLKDSQAFDPALLEFLVCPLSRKTLRYVESTNELINDELGIAYPIVDGIPNMIPQDAKMIQKDQKPDDIDHP